MITLEKCQVCESNQIFQYHQAGVALLPSGSYSIMPGVKVDIAVVSHYFICQSCHVIFQNPRMSDEELNKFYSKGFYRKTLSSTDEEITSDEASRAKNDAGIIKNFINRDIISHLDIGCGHGHLLEEIGAVVKVGVELDTDRGVKKVSSKEGIEIYPSMDQVPQKKFDLVTTIHTLEHVSDPRKYLKDMVKKVSPDGHLVIEVPTWKSPGGPLRLPHLFHFEPDVLRLMCQEVGLAVLETKFTPHLLLICKIDQT